MDWPENVIRALEEARVARLATVSAKVRPHAIPISYAFDGRIFYTAVDAKPKRVQSRELVRIRNIRANPRVALLIDEYHEDWGRLWYILIRGTASLLEEGEEKECERQKAAQLSQLLDLGSDVWLKKLRDNERFQAEEVSEMSKYLAGQEVSFELPIAGQRFSDWEANQCGRLSLPATDTAVPIPFSPIMAGVLIAGE